MHINLIFYKNVKNEFDTFFYNKGTIKGLNITAY